MNSRTFDAKAIGWAGSRPAEWLLWGAVIAIALYVMRWIEMPAILRRYSSDIMHLTVQHLGLVALSGGLAILVGIPLGILLSRPSFAKVSEPGARVLTIGSTIPSLAILALSMSWLGIGTPPAVFALWAVTLLPIVRNTMAGFRGVDPYLLEAGRGMGMTPMQLLLRVELPNALYVLLAGVRTALAINVGTVPMAFLIGGGGLGELIFTGIDLNEPAMMMAGAIPTAGLAVVVDFTLGLIANYLVPRGVNPQR
jgi:osmoprotectant transport system permease protein